MLETLPLATSPAIQATSDIFSPYITLPETPPSFCPDTSDLKHVGAFHGSPTSTINATQIPTVPQNGQTDSASSIPRKRRKGGKIFSGCSTCRQRKMKCDQRRPICSNCARSRLYVCRGYEDGSVPGDSTDGSRSQPQARPQKRPTLSPPSKSNDIEVEDSSSNFASETNSFPPFFFQDDISQDFGSSFLTPQHQSQSSRTLYGNQIETPLAHSDIPSFLDDISFWDQLLDTNDTTHQDSDRDRSLVPLPPLCRIASPISSHHHHHTFSPSLPNPTNIPAPFSELLHHYRTLVSQQMMPTSSPSQNPWLQLYLPLALQEPRTEPKQVLLHAILAVSAFSRAGLATGECEKFRRQGVLHSGEAVKRLREAIDGTHDERRAEGSGKNGERMDDVDKQALLAAALTISTIDVFSGADKGTGYTYLRMAKEVIHRTGGISWWLSEAPPSMTIFQIFRCYNIIASTTSWPSLQGRDDDQNRLLLEEDDENEYADIPPPRPVLNGQVDISSPNFHSPDPNPDSSTTSPPDHTKSLTQSHENTNDVASPPLDMHLTHPSPTHYTLDISFGIAIKTLWCLNKTVSLSNLLSTFPSSKTPIWTPSQLSEIRALEKELYFPLQHPREFRASDTNSGLGRGANGRMAGREDGVSQMVADEIKENHVWAFHYCVILFFRRALSHTLPPASAPTLPHIPSQTLLSHALTHLENIDSLTPSLPTSNTLWPGFIAAAEAVATPLRHRALAWFVRARRHGIGNIDEAKKLVMEVWRRLDRERYVPEEREGARGLEGELGGVDWRGVMGEMGAWVMLT